jgi:hypothetical protein
MGSRFQNSRSWKGVFSNLDGVQVQKQPQLEGCVFQPGWGPGSKTAAAGSFAQSEFVIEALAMGPSGQWPEGPENKQKLF